MNFFFIYLCNLFWTDQSRCTKHLSFKLCWICTINPPFEKEQLTSESLIFYQLGWCLLYFHLLSYTYITLWFYIWWSLLREFDCPTLFYPFDWMSVFIWRYLTMPLFHIPLLYFGSIVGSCTNPLLYPITTKQ